VNDYVIDATIAVKWVVPEPGQERALALRRLDLAAPELLVPECANMIWKKHRRGELSDEEARTALSVLGQATVRLFPMFTDLRAATELAIALGHPAYDCFYLALAERTRRILVTADKRLIGVVERWAPQRFAGRVISLDDLGPAGAV
jgi:predicted nucleic acid-binding protein